MRLPKMSRGLPAVGVLVACAITCGGEAGTVALVTVLPKPTFEGTLIDVRSPHREAYRGDGMPPPPLLVPEGTQRAYRQQR